MKFSNKYSFDWQWGCDAEVAKLSWWKKLFGKKAEDGDNKNEGIEGLKANGKHVLVLNGETSVEVSVEELTELIGYAKASDQMSLDALGNMLAKVPAYIKECGDSVIEVSKKYDAYNAESRKNHNIATREDRIADKENEIKLRKLEREAEKELKKASCTCGKTGSDKKDDKDDDEYV